MMVKERKEEEAEEEAVAGLVHHLSWRSLYNYCVERGGGREKLT